MQDIALTSLLRENRLVDMTAYQLTEMVRKRGREFNLTDEQVKQIAVDVSKRIKVA